MIGVPMPNPRDSLIANLNQQLDRHFSAGKQVQEIATGVSGEKEAMFGTSHCNKLRIERNKQMPRLREMAGAGHTVIEAAKVMGMEAKRARLIARENNIKFPRPPWDESTTRCASPDENMAGYICQSELMPIRCSSESFIKKNVTRWPRLQSSSMTTRT